MALDPEAVIQLMSPARTADGPFSELTAREKEVLDLMAQGRSNSGIAAEMFVTEGAVEKHISKIFDKLDLPPSGEDHRRVLVLCDLLGGTPFNVVSAIARRSPRIVCLSGMNLGVTVEAALSQGDLTEELVERLLAVGRDGIVETERHRARRAS